MKIYPLNARIPVVVDGITFHIAPLSHGARIELSEYLTRKGGVEARADLAYMTKCLQICLKKVEGIQSFDGSEYELKFDDRGFVTDECMDELGQVLASVKAGQAAAVLFTKMENPNIEGVDVQFDKVYLEEAKKKT